MATVKRFEDLEIWQMARELENKVFEETQKGKLSKDYKLKDQMNSAAGSIMDNIAEGFASVATAGRPGPALPHARDCRAVRLADTSSRAAAGWHRAVRCVGRSASVAVVPARLARPAAPRRVTGGCSKPRPETGPTGTTPSLPDLPSRFGRSPGSALAPLDGSSRSCRSRRQTYRSIERA